MKKIGILYGMENTFPFAFVDKINSMNVEGVTAESLQVGGVIMDQPSGYDLIVDRISQDIPFYRAFLKHAVLTGTRVINNPFWWTADDKFFNYALSEKLGVATPRTVLLPHNQHPPDTTSLSHRNLIFPLDWEGIFNYIGFPAFLKPYSGGGWKHVYKVHSPEEFFDAYNQTGDLCMTLQQGIEFDDYYRCYVIGQQNVHIMRYDPRRPHAERYVKEPAPAQEQMNARLTKDCLTLCRALGYDMNTVEFAVQDGVPYAIDFLNPAPDADVASVGQENFDWIVNAMATYAVEEVLKPTHIVPELRWAKFLDSSPMPAPPTAPKATRQKKAKS